jgi:hypothetical protein
MMRGQRIIVWMHLPMKALAVVGRSILAAVCVFAAAPSRAHGQIELYAGLSENRFSLLRDSAGTTGFEFGGRYGVLSWLALDAGYADFGTVSSAFPVTAIYPPGTVTVAVYTPTTGSNSLHVDARAVHLLPEFKCSFGHLLSASVGIGLARFETKIGSNEFYELPVTSPSTNLQPVPPPGWLPTYSGTRRSWTAIGKASLRATVSRSWMAEVNAHYTRASAIDTDYDSNADIGNRRLEILGVALDLIWRLPSK